MSIHTSYIFEVTLHFTRLLLLPVTLMFFVIFLFLLFWFTLSLSLSNLPLAACPEWLLCLVWSNFHQKHFFVKNFTWLQRLFAQSSLSGHGSKMWFPFLFAQIDFLKQLSKSALWEENWAEFRSDHGFKRPSIGKCCWICSIVIWS